MPCVETLFIACGTISLIGAALILLMVSEPQQDYEDG